MFTQIEDMQKKEGRWFERDQKDRMFPEEDAQRILSQEGLRQDYDFNGFAVLYKASSEWIGKERIIINLGCYLAPQCWYFREHAGYIGVDTCERERFRVENTEHFVGTVQEFLDTYGFDRMTGEERGMYYVIASYDLDAEAQSRIERFFGDNRVTFYPTTGSHGGTDICIRALRREHDRKLYIYLRDEETGKQFLEEAARQCYRFGETRPTECHWSDLIAVEDDKHLSYVGSIGRMAVQTGQATVIDYESGEVLEYGKRR